MPTTAASLLGNYAPAMQEPYAIETALAKEATGGSSALANTLLGQYWYERQLREGDYASRMADQMAFGKQQLAWQQADTALKAMPELQKNNLLPATAGILQSQLPGLDMGGLQFAAEQAANTSQAANMGNVGRFLSGAGAYGLNIPPAGLSAVTGIPDITPGTPTAVQAQAEANKGRIAAAALHAGAAREKTTNVQVSPKGAIGGSTINVKVPDSIVALGPDAVATYMQQHGWLSPQQVPSPYSTGAPNTAPPPITNVPPATTPAAPAAKPTAPAAKPTALPPGTDITANPGASSAVAAIRQQIAANKSLTPAMRSDLQNFKLIIGADHHIHLHGQSNKDYMDLGAPP